MLFSKPCADCKTRCDWGELIDGKRCFSCYITWRAAEDVREVERETGITGPAAHRIAALRSIERGKHAKAW